MTATAQAFDATERRQYIGGSEIAAIMGLDKWRTPLDVYNDKLGLTAPFEGNNHTERGNRLEAIACELFTELTGKKLIRRPKAYTHPFHSFIVGHVDRLIVGENSILEVKCPSVAAFRKYQREGLPESMVIQMQVYLALTGRSTGTWAIFCADMWELATFEIEYDYAIADAAIDWAARFWHDHIIPQIPPSTEANDTPTIEIAKHGGSVTVRDDEAFIAKAAALREAIELKRDAESLFELAKQDVIDAIEDTPGIYEGGGVRLHYIQTAGRASFDDKAFAAAHPTINLAAYKKPGKPSKTLKTYIIN